MPLPRIALVSATAARGLDDDMAPLLDAFAAAGADAAAVDWDDDRVEWPRHDMAILRSTWNYVQRLPDFLAFVDRAAARTRLFNPPEVVRWNVDKHYLADLARAGIATVPGAFIEPGDDAGSKLDAFLGRHVTARDFVVKPAVGAGSRDAMRHPRAARDAIVAHVRRLQSAQRSVLVQPYLDSVDSDGETALLFFDGAFSHAIRKGPLLKAGAGSTRALFAPEHITPREPAADELALAATVLDAIPFPGPLLYARVDLIRAGDGTPRLLELELVEPSVFVPFADGAAARFVHAALARASG